MSANEIESDLQLWTPIWLEFPVKQNLKATMEAQPRFSDSLQDPNLLILRPSVTYSVNPKLDLTTGYLWTPYLKTGATEHRIWQQAVYKHSLKKWNILHQLRIEERFLENEYQTSVRGRYQLMGIRPISKSKKYSAVIWDEVHLNLNDTRANPLGFNQNRIFAGIRRQLGLGFVEGGYLLQIVKSIDSSPHQFNHAIYTRLVMPLWKLK